MSARDEIIQKLWHGKDPFLDFPLDKHAVDHQGWNSEHINLQRAIDEVRPKIVLEIGVWKGGSAIWMAEKAKERGLDTCIICVDTWLGSTEHWINPGLHPQLRHINGYPQLFHTFVANVFDKGLQDYIVPLPLDGVNAVYLLKEVGIRPEVIHIDAGHSYESAYSDLEACWPLLSDQGVLVGDDYYTDGKWIDVQRAFDEFFAKTPHWTFEHCWGKCMVRKPHDGREPFARFKKKS